tara:strand:+ start:3800 stop:4648 length:849 start_codon:yes stop_codon:yes gene_type:complete
MSTWKITKEQFSDGSTIDGSRLARAIDDTVGYNNEVPLEAISKPRMPQFVILGANPKNNAAPVTMSPPWVNYNLQDPATSEVKFRAKGMAVSVTSNGTFPTTDGGLWTVSTIFDRPVIIDTICVHIESWDGWPILLTQPATSSMPDASLLQVMVDTDSVTAPEDRTVNSKEFHYRLYDPTVWRASYLNDVLLGASSDMTPARPAKLQDGTAQPAGYHSHVLESKDLNLPIHQFARVRFRLGFGSPGTNAAVPGAGSWETGGSATMHPGQPTWVIVYREQARG